MVSTATGADLPLAAGENVRARLDRRTAHAFVEEERSGLMLAAKTRTIALSVILLWQIFDNPQVGFAYLYELAAIVAFLVLGAAQYLSALHRFHVDLLKYIFVFADCFFLAAAFSFPNPYWDHALPASFVMHGSLFVFFFLFLMQSAFSLRPRLVLWCGLSIVMARTSMLIFVTLRPGVTTNLDLPELTPEALVAAFANPEFVFLGHVAMEVIVTLLVAGGLALVVGRSRRLVRNQSLAERARVNLARYFSPNMVDRLSEAGELLSAGREQNVAVLFADIVGFTTLCEKRTASDVIGLLRGYHDRLGQAVFDNGGTLDKYLGDGLMATFGTPEPDSGDARNALRCALDMLTALAAWNEERAAAGAVPVRVGIGLHYGKVIAGDIGNERRLEYGVIGDTVNIASRLEHLTRALNTPLVVSDGLVEAIAKEGRETDPLLDRLTQAGTQEIRGRESGVPVWILNTAAPEPARALSTGPGWPPARS